VLLILDKLWTEVVLITEMGGILHLTSQVCIIELRPIQIIRHKALMIKKAYKCYFTSSEMGYCIFSH
jgi:hypothetical protein